MKSPRYSKEGPWNERQCQAKDHADTLTATPKHLCRAVEKRDRVRIINYTCCRASIAIYVHANH